MVQNQTLAVDYFNQILTIDPANHYASYELGQLYFVKGNLNAAKEFAQKSVTVKTDNEWYWLLNAHIYEEQKDYILLEYALAELIKISPEKIEYSFDRANALFMMGKADEALEVYNSLEKKVGLSDQVLQGRQKIYLKKGNISKATADLEQLIKNNPSDVRYYLFLGDLYFSNEMTTEALAIYQKALELDDSDYEIWYNQGLAFRQLGRYEEAVVSFNKALELNPNDYEAWYDRGNALGDLSKYEDAITSFDKSLQINPDKHGAYYSKACAYALKDDLELALINLGKAINFLPQQYSELAKINSDFDNIRRDPRFQALIQ